MDAVVPLFLAINWLLAQFLKELQQLLDHHFPACLSPLKAHRPLVSAQPHPFPLVHAHAGLFLFIACVNLCSYLLASHTVDSSKQFHTFSLRQLSRVGVCSAYLDVGTTFNRLVYVVRLLTHNGFYVMLDNQFNLDTSVLDNQNQWLSDWTNLLKAVAQDPISRSRLMVDVLNV